MADDDVNDGAEDFGTISDQISAGIAKNFPLDNLRDAAVAAIVQGKHGIISSIFTLVSKLAAELGKALVEVEEPFLPIIASFVAPIVAGMFGTSADAGAFAARANREGRGAAAGALVDAYMESLAGPGDGSTEPSDEGAKRIAAAAVHATLEGSFQALITELCSDVMPFEIGHFEALGKLPEDIIRTLGVSRLVRRAFSPLVDATAATPMKRFANQKYRPNLLSEGDIARAFIAGDYSAGDAADELAQLGYTEKRQAVILKNALKWMSIADSLVLVRDGYNDRELAIENAKLSGLDDVGAEAAVLVEEVKHQNAIRDDSAAAIKAAYVDRRITDGDLTTYLAAIYKNDEDREAYQTAWRTIRDLNTKRLSPAEALSCVKAKVLPIAAYREALTLDGYSDEAVLSLELLLETELNAAADVDALRKQKTDDAAAAAKAKADAAAAKQAAVDAARDLARRGSLADLRRAVVRGLIPTSRYTEVLTPQYDGDTVATLVALVEQDRAKYLADQQKADDATKAAGLRHIDVGALQTAVLEGVLTVSQFRQQLETLNFAPADADILTSTLQAKVNDQNTAKQLRADAAAKAKTKSVDLNTFETLVRRGHRTIGEYQDLLTSLGYDAGAVAAMVDLLNLHIADDQAARDARAAAANKTDAKGLTLDQLRRAVILGLKTVDDLSAYLVANKYTIDAQGVLVAELRNDVAEADAARAKRQAAAAAAVETHAPLSTIARAARLGVIPIDVYRQRLVDAKYTDDDIAIEMDLLAVEIADAQAKAAAAAAAKAKSPDKGLSLDQLATAVKLGTATLDDYQARALALGYQAADVDTLTEVLADQVKQIQDAQARHTTIEGQLTARSLSLSELDAAVKANQLTIDDYTARLLALGYGADDADLLTTLLELKLQPPATGA